MRLRQVLFNLIGNAIKFTDKGEIRLTVETKTPADSDDRCDILITVADTGIGIPASDHKMIFDPFRQQKGQKAGKYGGTGLGLTISKRLAEAMNGSIALRSTPGQGSTFEITLPNIAITNAAAKSKKNKTSGCENIRFASANILLVDDVDFNRNLVKAWFDNMTEVTITEAENGSKAVSFAEQDQPDIILMDIQMPVMDGYQAIMQIKKNERLKSVPILAMTASAMKEEEKKIKSAGFDAYLTKPLRKAELFYELARFLPCSEKERRTEEKPPESESIEMSPESLARLPVIIYQLENEFMQTWETIRRTQTFDDMAKFALRIREFGESHSLAILAKYGSNLLVYVENFDIDNIDAALNAYPELIQKIKMFKSE